MKPKFSTAKKQDKVKSGPEASSQLDGDLSNDPIAQTMAIRIDLGGVNSKATEVEAKKKRYPLSKLVKHPAVKG